MRTTVAIGLVLVIAGALAMVLQLTGAFTETVGIDLGPVELEASREQRLPWLPWAAGAAVLVGVFLMVSGRRG
jgi:hypothetical protein